jgi:hypothetical protein
MVICRKVVSGYDELVSGYEPVVASEYRLVAAYKSVERALECKPVVALEYERLAELRVAKDES